MRGLATLLTDAVTLDQDVCNVHTINDLLNPEIQLAIYRHKATRQVVTVARKMESELASVRSNGKKPAFADVWNSIMSDFHALAKSHCYLIMLQSVRRAPLTKTSIITNLSQISSSTLCRR